MATRSWHPTVDEAWLALLRPTVTLASYRAQLVRMYGLVAPFEVACRYSGEMRAWLEHIPTTRAGLVARDLLVLGLTPQAVASLPQCESITTFRTIHDALGWMYVIERASLLQDGVKRHLALWLPEAQDACAYLSAHEQAIADHWQAVGRALDRAHAVHHCGDDIIRVGHEAFAAVRGWFGACSAATAEDPDAAAS